MRRHPSNKRQEARGFTVIELMVAVSLMTLIVLALFTMFSQTQRAMLANEKQVDTTERGRGVLELVSREIESARIGYRQDTPNMWVTPPVILTQNNAQPSLSNSFLLTRTNELERMFYLTKADKLWRGVGYVVLAPTNVNKTDPNVPAVVGPAVNGVGALYRYETPNPTNATPLPPLFLNYTNLFRTQNGPPTTWPSTTNFSQIAEGVVHFRVVPYDTTGRAMVYANALEGGATLASQSLDRNYRLIRRNAQGNALNYPASNIGLDLEKTATVELNRLPQSLTSTTAIFRSNALPAYVEVELGVLEPDALRTYNQMMRDEQPLKARDFLARRIAAVQIYRKRIPLRTAVQ